MFKHLLTAFVIAFMALSGTANVANARDGGGPDPMQKVAKELKAAGAPGRTRAKIIATVGTVGGTVVGELATTGVTCIMWCFGVDTGYRPGDMSKDAAKAIRKMWGIGEGKPARPRGYGLYQRSGLGTHMGYQAIPR